MCTRSVCLITFGCKVNQYEGQAIREELERHGLVPTDELQDGADAYVVNTCTVTDSAFREGLRTVRRLSRSNPDALVVVTGCAADSNAQEFRNVGVRVSVFGNADKPGIAGFLAGKLERLEKKDLWPGVSRFPRHTRAFLKVQDGCDLNCSFCIIPLVRGPNRSRPMEEAVEEARRLAAAGYREIVLTGVHLGSFGKSRGGRRSEIPQLLRRVIEVPGVARVRMSSIEINEVTDELIELMATEPRRICPHLHLPAQSGSDDVLRAMRRRYSTAGFERIVEKLRAALPDPSLTTDLIVGYPTETERHFEETLAFCRRVGFGRVHIFPYSPRQGTDAAALPDLPWRVKKERLHRLEQVAQGLAAAYASKFVGREVEVVVEEQGRGYTERYVRAALDGSFGPGQVARARGVEARGDTLVCKKNE